MEDVVINLNKKEKDSRKRVLFYNDTSLDNHYGSELTSLILKQIIRKKSNLVKVIPVGYKWNIDDLEAIDTIIINGEGTFHDFSSRADRIHSLAQYAYFMGKRVSIINASIYNLPDFMDLGVFDFISVREKYSFDYVKKKLKESKLKKKTTISLCFDASLCYNSFPKNIQREGYIITDSVVPGVKDQLYKYFKERQEIDKVKYIPFIRNDLFSNFYNVAKAFRSAEFIITGRFHGVCFSIMTNTPFMALPSNTSKIESLIDTLSIGDCCTDSLCEGIKDSLWDNCRISSLDFDHNTHLNLINEMIDKAVGL